MKKIKLSKILTELKIILRNKNRWIKRNFSTDNDGNRVHPSDIKACNFCIMGALYQVINSQTGSYKNENITFVVNYLNSELYNFTNGKYINISTFNDDNNISHSQLFNFLRYATSNSRLI